MLQTMDGSMFDQVVVGGGASLANLIVHAILLGAIAWVVRRLRMSDGAIPSFLQYTLVIVATGTLLVAGHFGEVVPVPKWHLLGPMTALNGVMLIGWSTALIFEILHRSASPAQTR